MKYLKLKFLLMFFALAMAIPPAWADVLASADFTQGNPVESGNGTWSYYRLNTSSTYVYLPSGGYIRYTDNSLPSTVNMTVETSGYTGSMNVNGGTDHSFTANETYTFEDVAVTDGTVTLNSPSGFSPNIAKLTITTASGGDEPTLTTKTSTIVFGDNGSDASQDLGAQADGLSLLKAYTTEGADLIADFEGSKVYKGITGLKFSTSSVDGNLVITLAPSWKATKITVNAKYYNTNTTSKIKITAGNSQTEFYTLTKDYTGYDLSFSEATDITTIRLDAYNRMYVKSITIEYVDDGAPYITVDPPTGLTINDATGDNKTGTLTATLMNGQGGITAATNPSDKWSWSNNTVTFNGKELGATGDVTFSATDATDVEVDLEYNYTGPLYIIGYVNGGDWSANNMVQMDGPDADGIYSVTLPITPNGNNNSEISFSKRMGSVWNAWGEIYEYRFVPVSNGPWGLTEGTLGGWHSLDFDPSHVDAQKIVMPAGTYTISIDAKNNKFKIERYETPVPKIYNKVTDESQLIAGKKYILVYENEETPAFCGEIITSSSNHYGKSVTGPAISEGSVNIYGYNDIKELTLSGNNNNWLFLSDEGYLYWKGGNTLDVSDDISDNKSKWTVTPVETGFSLYNNAASDARVIRYNPSSPRFACYAETSSTMKSVFLYVEDGVDPVLPAVAEPVITPNGGNFAASQEVTITCETSGATIRYTTDGTDPTATTGTVYDQPFTLNATTTVKAIAVLGEETSQVVSATFTKTGIETIAAANAQSNNTQFTFIGEAVVTFHRSNHLFVRDNSGSGLIYGVSADGDHKFNNGDVLKPEWKAKYTLYNQNGYTTPEFVDPTGVEFQENNGPAAPEMLGTLATTDVNKYVGFNNVTVVRQDRDNKNYYITVGEKDICLRAAYEELVPSLVVGKTYNVTGVVAVYENNPQLNLISATIVKQDLTLGFNPAEVSIYVGDTFTAPALTGVPEGETIDVTYSSNNTNVATVVDNVVTLVEGATGTATITANFAGNDYYNPASATYTITVNEKLAHGMSFSAETLNVTYGDEEYTTPTLNNPNSLTVTYESDNEDVAVVDENTGELVLGDAGTAVITAKTNGDTSHNGGSVSYTINIAKAPAGLSYGETTPEFTVYVDQDFEAPTLTNPNNLTVTYESNDEDVALVDETGDVLIGEKVGDATITASVAESTNYLAGSASYIIHVIAKEDVTMSFNPTSVTLYLDQEFAQPTLTTNPANLAVKYSSNNEEVAMVDETSGEVLLMDKVGTATITAKYAGNDQYNANEASYTIKVENRPEILIETSSLDLGTAGEGTIFVMASDLKEDVTVTSSNSNFKVEPETITPEQAANGVNVTVTYIGNNAEGESATFTFSTKDGEDVKVTVTAKAETYVDIAKPTFSPAAGTYTEPKEVAIACATPGVTIEYTINGVTKTYDGPFTVGNENGNSTVTVTATASKGSKVVYNDSQASATYVINAAPAAGIEDGYYSLQNNAEEVAGKYANVAGRRTLNFVADPDDKAGTIFRIKTDPDTVGQIEMLRSQGVDLQGYANRAMAYVPKAIELVLSKLANSSLGDPETPGDGILGENGLDLILKKFYEKFDYNLYIEGTAEGGYRIYGKTPSMQHVVDFYHENTAQVEAKLPMLEGYINQVLDKIRNRIPAPYNANVVLPFSLKAVRDSIAKKNGITLIDPTEDEMGFYRQVLNNKEYVWDFAYQTAMMYVDAIKATQTYAQLPAEYKLYVEKMEKVRPDTKYYIIERGNELDYISENNVEIINNDPRTLWTITERETFKLNSAGELFGCPLATTGVGGYFTTNYTDFAYTLPEGVTAYKVTGVNEDGEAQLEALEGTIPAQTPVLLVAKEDGAYEVTLTTDAGTAVGVNLLQGPDYLITEYQITTPIVVQLFGFAQGILGDNLYNTYVAPYEYLQLRYSGTVNNKYFWNVNSDLDDLNGDCVVRSLATDENGKLAFSDHWKTENNKAFMVSEDYNAITLPGSLRGDVNHDGIVHISDVPALIDRLLEADFRACPYCSDVNEDNVVNIRDVTALIDILLGVDGSTTGTEEGGGE